MSRSNLCIKAVEVIGIFSLLDSTINIRYEGLDYYAIPVRICTDRVVRKKMKQGLFDWAVDEHSYSGGAWHFVLHSGLETQGWPQHTSNWLDNDNCPSVIPEAWAVAELGVDDDGNDIIVGFQSVVGVKQHNSGWNSYYCYNGTNYGTWEGYIEEYPNPDDYPPNYRFYAAPTYWPYVEILHTITEGEDDFIKATVYDLVRGGIAMCPTPDYTALFRAEEHYSTYDYRGLWWGNGMVRSVRIKDDQSSDILGNTFLKPHINTAHLYSYYNSLIAPKQMRPVMVPYTYKTDILLDNL